MDGINKLKLKTYSYKELCELFGEKTKAGNSKISQRSEWARYFRWTQPTSQKYKVEEIYDEPLECKDGRRFNGGNNTSKFLSLDDEIMGYFESEETEAYEGTLGRFCEAIGILTSRYIRYNMTKYELIEMGFPKYVVNKFYWAISSIVHRAVISSLERLQKDNYLKFQRHIVIVCKTGAKIQTDKKRTEEIIKIEEEVLQELGYTRRDLMEDEKSKEYKLKVNYLLFERYGYEVRYYFRNCDIKLTGIMYQKKSDESSRKLIRKFVKSICYIMICLEIPNGDNIPGVGYNQTQLIRDTITLINMMVACMNLPKAWDEFWNDNEIDWDDNASKRETVFWTQFLLTIMADEIRENRKIKNSEKSENNEQRNYREELIQQFGEYIIGFAEKLMPNINWEKVCNEEKHDVEQSKLIERVCNAYNIALDRAFDITHHDEFSEAYAVFAANTVASGKMISEVPHMWDFKEEWEKQGNEIDFWKHRRESIRRKHR